MTKRKRVKTPVAAEHLGIAEVTLKNSRITGKLGHLPAPPYYKIGKNVEYDPDELREFLAADLIEVPVAPGFKAQLRRKLWRIVKLRYGRTPPA